MRIANDWELAAQARSGSEDAFAELVRRYQQPVTHFCQRMTGSMEDAEDIAQECFVRLYRYLGRLEERAKFSTVVFGIARNVTLNYLRDEKRRGRGRSVPLENQRLAAGAHETPSSQAESRELAACIDAGIAALRPEHREVLILREVQGLDYESIARVLGCRLGTVRSRLARAREQLRQRLESTGEFDR